MDQTPPRRRRTKAEVAARAGEAFSLWLAGHSYAQIADRLGYGNAGNSWRAVQRYIAAMPQPETVAHRRLIEHQRLDSIWRLAYSKASEGDVPAMRVLVEVSRRRSLLEGLDRPVVLQIDAGSAQTAQQAGPTLREVLPEGVVMDDRSVRAQALALHRALPSGQSEAAAG